MDIVVKGRKTEVPERFRKHVSEKLEKIQKLDGKVISLDVEVSKEPNPRQADRSDRVEITLLTRGPVVRAEASAADPYAALDLAVSKLEARLRKAADKRRVHRGGSRTPTSVAEATAGLAGPPPRRAAQCPPRRWGPSRSRAKARWWCVRRPMRRHPWRLTRRSTKWNWLGMTSICSSTPTRECRVSFTAGTATTTALSTSRQTRPQRRRPPVPAALCVGE